MTGFLRCWESGEDGKGKLGLGAIGALRSVSILAGSLIVASCANPDSTENNTIEQPNGTSLLSLETREVQLAADVASDDKVVSIHTLSHRDGPRIEIMSLGATIMSLEVPDRNGDIDDVVLGFDNVEQYLTDSPYFGAVVGRYANRIAGGRFSIDGVDYNLSQNDGANTLHGGHEGFDKKNWAASTFTEKDRVGVVFTYLSEVGEEGFPGELSAEVRYSLDEVGRLWVDYAAETDRATIVNLSQHSYFNLNGHGSGDVLDHQLKIVSEGYTPVDASLIPTGEIQSVTGTPFDFSIAKPIGREIDEPDPQLEFGRGYDHNWVLDPGTESIGSLSLAAELAADLKGRTLRIYTDQPGLQFYSGNFLDGSITGKDGVIYGHRQGLCLETQRFPDSPNQPSFPSAQLQPGETYRTTTIFEFGVMDGAG